MLPEECGKPMSAIANGLGVRLYRDGKPYGFWEPEAASLVVGRISTMQSPGPRREADAA